MPSIAGGSRSSNLDHMGKSEYVLVSLRRRGVRVAFDERGLRVCFGTSGNGFVTINVAQRAIIFLEMLRSSPLPIEGHFCGSRMNLSSFSSTSYAFVRFFSAARFDCLRNSSARFTSPHVSGVSTPSGIGTLLI